eukprot:TRINITY_DN4687_c0_g1_i1.p1 TRINITY_DN4687_c0_g1~~TRINITY_DN4687_c0_g1_i1.p1  ORF type:complete len:162 (-),score=37.55 TRINITY_DN4687_c0_g1_i1:60-545(-)
MSRRRPISRSSSLDGSEEESNGSRNGNQSGSGSGSESAEGMTLKFSIKSRKKSDQTGTGTSSEISQVRRKPRPASKSMKQILSMEKFTDVPVDQPTYVNIEAPPSLRRPAKYSDISGFPAPYTDPRTFLRYANMKEYAIIQDLAEFQTRELLALRNANPFL